MDARPGVPAGGKSGLTGESKMEGQTVAHGVVTEIFGFANKQQNNGNVHVIKDAIPGHVLIKDPTKDSYDQIRVEKPRRMTAATLAGVVQLVQIAKDRFQGKPVVFVDRTGVIVSFDEHKESLFLTSGSMPHRWTPEWTDIRSLASAKSRSFDEPDNFRKWLREEMKDAATGTSDAVQKALISITSVTTGTRSDVRTDSARKIGRDMEAELVLPGSQVDDGSGKKVTAIPDRFTLNPRIVMDPKLADRQEVEFALHIEPETLEVKIVANGPQVEEGIEQMLGSACDEIEAGLRAAGVEDVPVILGSVA